MNPQGSENIERISVALWKAIGQPIDVGDQQVVINASIGIAVYPDGGTSEDELIRNADTAMYRAKKAGTGCIVFNALDTEGAPQPSESIFAASACNAL
jgi:diguanylate cyclase (GGDEF)-like protein